MPTRTCTKCDTEKDDTCFHNHRKVCKSCVKIERKDKEAAYLEKAKDITKTCTVCEQEFDGTHFKYDSSTCKECTKKKNSRVTNKPTEDMPDKTCTKCSVLKKATDYRFRSNVCIECEKQDMYQWRKNNPEKFKEHLQRYRSTPEYKEKNNAYKRNKYNTNIIDRISHLYRHRIRRLIREKKDGLHMELLGCNYTQLLEWLEYNFKDGMTWDNYGTIWHIDHIIPCSSYNFNNVEDQKKCFHWTNMAPLEVTENIKKGNKILPDYISYYETRVIEFLNKNINLDSEKESL